METSILEELGLSHAESKIYLTLLETGQSKTGPLIHSTKLQSSTVYHILGSLLEKGLVSSIFKGKIKYYQAENPESFLFFLEEKKRKFEEILPSLKEKETRTEKQNAKVYEGIKGLKIAFNDILVSMKPGEEYCFFQAGKENLSDSIFRSFFKNYHLKRSNNGVKVRGLSLRENKILMKSIYDMKNTRIRYSNEILPTGIVVYKNKTITLDWGKTPTAFVIQSESVASSYKKFFEEKWKAAKS